MKMKQRTMGILEYGREIFLIVRKAWGFRLAPSITAHFGMDHIEKADLKKIL